MELQSQEADIPIPINSAYVGGPHGHHGDMTHHHHPHDPSSHTHIIPSSQIPPKNNNVPMPFTNQDHYRRHHHQRRQHDPSSHTHINPSNNNAPIPSTNQDHQRGADDDDDDGDEDHGHHHAHVPIIINKKKKEVIIKYKECMKNHAASMGGNALDGCGEFMPSGDDGTIESLTCSACHCHRNFHRKEIQGDPHVNSQNTLFNFYPFQHLNPHPTRPTSGRNVIIPPHKGIFPTDPFTGYPSTRPIQVMPFNAVRPTMSESDEQVADGGGGVFAPPPMPPRMVVKKRFRTKFTQEQKEKMFEFAENVGWKIQALDENVVQKFCQEIGVKRRVLKVWMHNNKHNLAKKINPINPLP